MKTEQVLLLRPGKDYIGVGCGAILVNEKNEVLLLELAQSHSFGGFWVLPGGKVQHGETPKHATIREIYEEIGVEIEIIQDLPVHTLIFPERMEHWVSFAYVAKIIKGVAQNKEPDKHSKMQWFSFDNLPTNLTEYCRTNINEYLKLYSHSRA